MTITYVLKSLNLQALLDYQTTQINLSEKSELKEPIGHSSQSRGTNMFCHHLKRSGPIKIIEATYGKLGRKAKNITSLIQDLVDREGGVKLELKEGKKRKPTQFELIDQGRRSISSDSEKRRQRNTISA